MKVKQLSEKSNVPLSKIKYYIREGLLPAGSLSAPNQASYDESHLERLDLIRALRDIGGLSIDVVRQVLRAVDKPKLGADPVEVALLQRAGMTAEIEKVESEPEYQRSLAETRDYIRSLDWYVDGIGEGYICIMADAIFKLRQQKMWPESGTEYLEPYVSAAWRFSEIDVNMVPGDDSPIPALGDPLTNPTRMAVLGTIVSEPLIMSLRSYANTLRVARMQEGLPLPPAD